MFGKNSVIYSLFASVTGQQKHLNTRNVFPQEKKTHYEMNESQVHSSASEHKNNVMRLICNKLGPSLETSNSSHCIFQLLQLSYTTCAPTCW